MKTKTTLLSFHGKAEIKEQYLTRLRAHAAADEIIKGQYWSGGKGCAVGCTVHSDRHNAYEIELGIPMILARLEDRFFEGMPNKDAKEFPLRFLSAIPVGVDLKNVWRKFMAWMLIDPEHGIIKFVKDQKAIDAITNVANAFENSTVNTVDRKEWIKLRDEARSASKILWAAAAAYADAAAAAAADAAADAAYAADAAAAAAAYADAAAAAAAYADAAAADAAAAAAAAAAAYADADAAARKKSKETTFLLYGNKLIQLLSEAK
jgi:hypothetical protein